jgi:hypothetical protein
MLRALSEEKEEGAMYSSIHKEELHRECFLLAVSLAIRG